MNDQILHLPLRALAESPFNPRKTFDDAALQELANSIKEIGVQQPVVVRAMPGPQTDVEYSYEIVFGHRRTRAARLAGLEYMPCILSNMDDQQAAIAQVHENLHRADVNAVEEADGLARLHQVHSMAPPAIAMAIGKSLSYVYNTLRLHSAAPELRDAIASQGMPRETAVEVARLKHPDLQRKALDQLRNNGAWSSYRVAKALLRSMFSLRANGLVFDISDASLCPDAGACNTCPKLAGNDEGLAAALDADICTDSTCYDRKVRAAGQAKLQALRDAGCKVVEGDEAKAVAPQGCSFFPRHTLVDQVLFPDYAGGSDTEDDGPGWAEALQKLVAHGRTAPEVVHLLHPQSGRVLALVADTDVNAMHKAWAELHGRQAGPGLAGAGQAHGTPPQGGQADPMADWTPAERATTNRQAMDAARVAVVKQALASPRTTDDLREIALREFEYAGDMQTLTCELMGLTAEMQAAQDAALAQREKLDLDAWMAARLARMTADQLAALVVGWAVEDRMKDCTYLHRNGSLPAAQRAVATASRYGVDLAAVADEVAHDAEKQ
jgi:ParB/RepB/Spo0J family partition protein